MTDRPAQIGTGLIAVALALLGYLAGGVGASLLIDLVVTVTGDVSPVYDQWIAIVGLGIGSLATIALYFVGNDRDWSYLDISVPDARAVGIGVLGFGGCLGVFVAGSAVANVAGIEFATSGVERAIRADPDPVAVGGLIVLTLSVTGPTEELLYRNLVQKHLREVLSAPAAIALASAIFAALHLGQYAGGDAAGATLVSLGMVGALAVILGTVYELTDTIVVPAAVHGLFNAVQMAWIWLAVCCPTTV